ncbi:PREDICTED: dolichol-phosphate mannosyltransferase subunit 3-like [Priapulus caudatus]|uniref:Dolichol-phosphate mannosyltransferase subunit 3 n=1 Tax=Priapulus caudatus TaxID=37621 RepID=A0ABM1F362_PRICU|nr:PREDICTED: dolichol-phosphate mannosyltransferase subunit 3-like [Priapulus caudatus]
MTKLKQWLLGLSLLVSIWASMVTNLFHLPRAFRQIVWALPVYMIIVFGCISLAIIGFRVATFNDCEDAADELKQQIEEAKTDLKRKGMKFS